MQIFDKIKSEYLSHKNIAGIYAILELQNDIRFYYVELRNEKGQVKIAGRKCGLNFNEIKKELPANIPVCLAVSGRGIIHKSISVKEGLTDEQIVQKVLPNATSENFYLQKQPVNETELYATLIRKDFVDEMMQKFIDEKIQVIDLSFGPFALNNVLQIVSGGRESLITTNFQVETQRERICNIVRIDEGKLREYRLEDDVINSDELIPFAAGLTYFLNTSATGFYYEPVGTIKEELQYKKRFRFAGWSIMIFFLILLMMNYLFFEKYTKKYNHLNKQYFQNEQLIQQLNSLKAEYKQKEQFINETGLLNPTRFSYYADRIALNLPASITLTKLEIQPLTGRVKQLKEIVYNDKKISVSGFTLSSSNVDKWIKVLKKEDWVSNIEIINITKAKKSNNIDFRIEITF